jgi:Flp pilus assembly protein TadG
MRWQRDEGSAVLETVLVIPLFLMVLAAIVGGARVTLAHQRVDAAAAQAARAAASARTSTQATALAREAASSFLQDRGFDCSTMTVAADTRNFRAGGSVSVTVSCHADLGSGVPGLSGSRTISGRGSEVIDTYRQVTP